jgi:protein gp37
VVQRSKTTFYAPLSWEKKAAATGERTLVFTCSWSDFFIEEADPWRPEVWEIIRNTPHLTYQILTKRPENVLARLPADWGGGWPNVWIGVSVENQDAARKRLPILREIPAVVRFLSMEPLLERVKLLKAVKVEDWDWDEVNAIDDDGEPEELIEECEAECDWINYGNALVVNPEYREWVSWRQWRVRLTALTCTVDWIIAGGESGFDARLTHPDWLREIRDLCQVAKIPFYFKQRGQWTWNYPQGLNLANRKQTYFEGVSFYRVGKKLAGRELDGRTWDEFPASE